MVFSSNQGFFSRLQDFFPGLKAWLTSRIITEQELTQQNTILEIFILAYARRLLVIYDEKPYHLSGGDNIREIKKEFDSLAQFVQFDPVNLMNKIISHFFNLLSQSEKFKNMDVDFQNQIRGGISEPHDALKILSALTTQSREKLKQPHGAISSSSSSESTFSHAHSFYPAGNARINMYEKFISFEPLFTSLSPNYYY